ncbi:hypothetical protein BX592_10346 [Paraburkholderia rhizosphaerae]|uniref:Uncharacterized protein n=1 Tax=Paraburkholderia rhizosphaerae TaxID=480658 RepID=A0A4R8M055_9BURK|nr:hypothetical protein BX592_10346 [Paraburkholderia rhizosphaerae]
MRVARVARIGTGLHVFTDYSGLTVWNSPL